MTTQPHILVVDDEPDLREILQCNLEAAGYAVDTAASAEEALALLAPHHSLILLDVMLGGMSGFKMAERLRKDLDNKIPIVFLTAKDTERDMLTGFSAGGDDYISKPFSLHEVLARVKAVLAKPIVKIAVILVVGLLLALLLWKLTIGRRRYRYGRNVRRSRNYKGRKRGF